MSTDHRRRNSAALFVRPMKESIGKREIRPPVIVTTETFKSLHTWLRRGRQLLCNFFVKIGSVGASPQIGDSPFLFSRSCAQVELLDRFSRFMAQTTCFRAMKCLLAEDNNKNGVLYRRPMMWWNYFLLFYMCHSMMGLTRCYQTAVFYILSQSTAEILLLPVSEKTAAILKF